MQQRMGRGAYLGVWAVLTAGQIAVLTQLESLGTYPAVALLIALHLSKAPITAMRLNDLGRPPSDAMFLLLPVANIVGFFNYAFSDTPKEKAREKRRRGWSDQIGPVEALWHALPIMARTAPIGIVMSVFYGTVSALGMIYSFKAAEYAVSNPNPALTMGFAGAAVFCLVWFVIQMFKRSTASRLSWLPALLMLPGALVAGTLWFAASSSVANMQFAALLFISMAWTVVWMTFGGAAFITAVTLAAEDVRNDRSVNIGKVFQQVFARTLDVAAPHGTKVQAVTIGMQLLIPGVFYMLQLAFADTIAVLRPAGAALAESAKLTWGIRQRIFKMYLLLAIVFNAGHFGLMLGLDGFEAMASYFLDPRLLSVKTWVIAEIWWAIYIWLAQVALFVMYHDRVAFLKKRRAERKAAKEAKKEAQKVTLEQLDEALGETSAD